LRFSGFFRSRITKTGIVVFFLVHQASRASATVLDELPFPKDFFALKILKKPEKTKSFA
jgi:hypothetical protein